MANNAKLIEEARQYDPDRVTATRLIDRLADALETTEAQRGILAKGLRAAMRIMEMEAVPWDIGPLGSSHDPGLDKSVRDARRRDEARRDQIQRALTLIEKEPG